MSVINRMLRDLDARGARPAASTAPRVVAADVQAALQPTRRPSDDLAWSAWGRTSAWSAVLALAVGTWVLGPPWIESALRPLPGHGPAVPAAHAHAPDASGRVIVLAAAPAAGPAETPQAGPPRIGMDWDLRHLPSHRPAQLAPPAQPLQSARASEAPRPQAQAYVAPGTPALPQRAAPQPAPDRQLFAAAGNKDLFTLVSPPAAGHPLPPPAVAATVTPARPAGPAQRAAAALEQAQALVDDNRAAEALEAARTAVRLDPSQAEARRLAVRLAIEVGDLGAAMALIDDGLARNPADAELRLLRARQLIAQGRQAEALAALQVLGAQNPEASGLRAGLLANSGDYARAIGAYEQALRLRPTNATWWLGMGVALDNQGQPRQAREAYARARALGTLRPELMAWLDQKLQ